jgi:hypothetical protein
MSPYPVSLRAVLTCVAIVAVGGCAAKEHITSWDCPKMREVQKEWELLFDTAEKTRGQEHKDKYGGKNEKLYDMLDRILKSNLSYDDLRNLTATCGTLPVRAEDRSEFAKAVLAYMERTFIDSGDRDNLVTLLSTRCQLRICGYEDIEFYLAFWGKKLKDPILVLGEAFSKCKEPAVRHDLAGAVRRGFVGQGIRGKDDAEYVTNAMQWYEKEKNDLAVNVQYWQTTMWWPAEIFDEMPEYYDKLNEDPARHRVELLFTKKPPKK